MPKGKKSLKGCCSNCGKPPYSGLCLECCEAEYKKTMDESKGYETPEFMITNIRKRYPHVQWPKAR